MASSPPPSNGTTYEDLAALELEFEAVDLQIMRQQYALTKPLYAKRTALTSSLVGFWPLVFEQAPVEIDTHIQPADSVIFASALERLEVSRPELDADPEGGDPRSVTFAFTFSDNDAFEACVLKKTWWYRRARKDASGSGNGAKGGSWSGLVSEPVRIPWKKGKDLSRGQIDMAADLFEARRKIGDFTAKGLPEYTALKKRIDGSLADHTFFNWFGSVSSFRYVTSEESNEAKREAAEDSAKQAQTDAPEDGEEEEEETDDEVEGSDQLAEIHQYGDELAICIADDLWPNALKFFAEAQDDDLSEGDFEDGLDVDEEDDEEDESKPVDIRALVGGSSKRPQEDGSRAPSAKKQKR